LTRFSVALLYCHTNSERRVLKQVCGDGAVRSRIIMVEPGRSCDATRFRLKIRFRPLLLQTWSSTFRSIFQNATISNMFYLFPFSLTIISIVKIWRKNSPKHYAYFLPCYDTIQSWGSIKMIQLYSASEAQAPSK
jgi:hypothetical protein